MPRGAEYDARWTKMAASGQSIHGEVDLLTALCAEHDLGDTPTVLDAGCGTGRVAMELAARGARVTGVDLDPAMLAEARTKAPTLEWVHGDLVDVELDTTFDLVVMAGNVMIFVAPGTEAAVVANMAGHVRHGGLVVAGFQTGAGHLTAAAYDRHAAAAGLERVSRWATWNREPFADGHYVVSVHRRP